MTHRWSRAVPSTKKNHLCRRVSQRLSLKMNSKRNSKPIKMTNNNLLLKISKCPSTLSCKKQKLFLPFISLLLPTIRIMKTLKPKMYTIDNICKNVLDQIILYQGLSKLSITNIRKLLSLSIAQAALTKVSLHLIGIFRIFLNFKKKLSLKSFRKK